MLEPDGGAAFFQGKNPPEETPIYHESGEGATMRLQVAYLFMLGTCAVIGLMI
jgi:hypothetical protein